MSEHQAMCASCGYLVPPDGRCVGAQQGRFGCGIRRWSGAADQHAREIARLRAEVERLTRQRDEAVAALTHRPLWSHVETLIHAAEVRGAAWMREAFLAQMTRARETYRSRTVDAAHAGDEHAENTWRACTDAVRALAGWLTQRDPEQVCVERREREDSE